MATDKENNAPSASGSKRPLATVESITKAIGDWKSWSGVALEGPKNPPLRKRISPQCLFWGLPTNTVIHLGTTQRLVNLRKRVTKSEQDVDWCEELETWQEETAEEISLPVALQSLAWAHALPVLGKRLGERAFCQLLAKLLQITDSAIALADVPTVRSILSAELPIALAYALPDLKPCAEQKRQGRKRFEQSMDELTDGEGMPHGQRIADIQILLASGLRTLTLDGELKKGRINKAARLQFDWLSRQCLRFTRASGCPMFTTDADAPHFSELMEATLAWTGDASDDAAYRKLQNKKKGDKEAELPTCSEHSEWSEVAVMRTGWDSRSAHLALNFSRPEVQVELGVGKHVLLRGACTPHITIAGQRATPESDWEEVCWDSDDDMDYLELECRLAGEWRLQRQFLLAREDQFAYMADALLGPSSESISYRNTFPLCQEVTLEQDDEANEAAILNASRRATLIPLALPEWQLESRTERLRVDPPRLDIQRTGRALYAPVFIDLAPKRLRRALTWRRLTVAENLQILPAEAAQAFRLQIGKEQWVFYRSLDRPAVRTFLGLNLLSEFLAARFDKSGEIETLVDIAG